jgi:hypothetical protein
VPEPQTRLAIVQERVGTASPLLPDGAWSAYNNSNQAPVGGMGLAAGTASLTRPQAASKRCATQVFSREPIQQCFAHCHLMPVSGGTQNRQREKREMR